MMHCLMPLLLILLFTSATAQCTEGLDVPNEKEHKKIKPKILYGTASYYAHKFYGRQTANGSSYNHKGMTAACNKLSLRTWIRVTNLRNGRSVIVEINDRLHPKNKRVVDLSKNAAQQLGYIKRGLTEVRIEVLGTRKPVSKKDRK